MCVVVCVSLCGVVCVADVKEESIWTKHCEARRGPQNVSKLKTHFCPVCVVLLGYLGLSVD